MDNPIIVSALTALLTAAVTVLIPQIFGWPKNRADYASQLLKMLNDVTQELEETKQRVADLENEKSNKYLVTTNVKVSTHPEPVVEESTSTIRVLNPKRASIK